ncbi:hypothetical protein BCR36DRAFT_352876 [Piromyces finnis]|uniref:Uncharacterized protein n=1 Tax=Piromyces finnis TaxID=1754191 RepID=A0A1Y1V9V2_9FUNG|nr:hypothetical protein BCR36DRAFT_352876 [Piromyces finnis]|eukprot:ORX50012.1 hypothetical protein BCR36DRAFT_352876 [Piromyces finnis]
MEEHFDFKKQLIEKDDDKLGNSFNNLEDNTNIRNTLNSVKNENNNLKRSPFFLNKVVENKKDVLSIKVDRKKLKLSSNKKNKKNKKSSQNLFALSFFKNNEKKKVNSNTNNTDKSENVYNGDESKYIKQENNILNSNNNEVLIEKNVNNEKNESTIENINIGKQNEDLISDNTYTYESQKCPICNICLDFYTLSEREKHVNLCIDSSLRKDGKTNFGVKKEDKKISSFYKNIKNNNSNERLDKERELNEYINTDTIQNEFITNTLNDIESTNISRLPSDKNQFECKICEEDNSFSNIIDLCLHIIHCFSKIEPDHFFFKEKINFILNQNVCFCCLKPWPIYEEKAIHLKECISIKRTYLEKIDELIKHYLKLKEEKEKLFLDKNSKYRNFFKGSIYLKKKKVNSMQSEVTSINKNSNNNNNNNNNSSNNNGENNNTSIFNLDSIKNEFKENQIENENNNKDNEDIKENISIDNYDVDMEKNVDKRCCFCSNFFDTDDIKLIDQHVEVCINQKIDVIENLENKDYKPKYIQKLTRCPCCSKKWLEYSMADLKEKLIHIRDCSKKNELPFNKISFLLNQYKIRFLDEEEEKRNNSNSNLESDSSQKKEKTDKNISEYGSDNDLFETKQTNEEIKQSINKRKFYNEEDNNDIIVLKIEDEASEDFNSNSISLNLTTNNSKSFRQRTLYDDIEEDHLRLAKVLSKSLYQDETQKIRLKIMNTSSVLSVEDAHKYNFSRAKSILNLTQQKPSLWEMSALKPEDTLKAETVIEPLQKHAHELRMSLKSEGVDEYIATLTFPIPDRRLLKVNSIDSIDTYFNDQINNRKIRLDKYKKLLTLQTSLWIKKMRKKQQSLKKELFSLDLENPESMINTDIYKDTKSELNNVNDKTKSIIEFNINNNSNKENIEGFYHNDIVLTGEIDNINSPLCSTNINDNNIINNENPNQPLCNTEKSNTIYSNDNQDLFISSRRTNKNNELGDNLFDNSVDKNDRDLNNASENLLFGKDNSNNNIDSISVASTINNEKQDIIEKQTNKNNQNLFSDTISNMDID